MKTIFYMNFNCFLLSSALATGDKQDLLEEREKRFKCAEHAFLCTMRSWSGLCQMCQSRQIGNFRYNT